MAATTPLLDLELRCLVDRPLLPADTFLSVYLDASVNAQGQRDFESFLDGRARITRERIARLPVDLRGYDELIGRIRRTATGTDFDGGVEGLAFFAEVPPAADARVVRREREEP